MTNGTDCSDMYTACINRLAGLFYSSACEGWSLQDEGYRQFVDPKYDLNNQHQETDLLSIGANDAQHFKIVGAQSISNHNDGIIHDKDKLKSQLEEIDEYQNISPSVVEDFLKSKGVHIQPTFQEYVALLPKRAYKQHQSVVDDFCKKNGVIVWTADIGGAEIVQKVNGKHNVSSFNNLLSERGSQHGIELCDIDASILPVVRKSDMNLIKHEFSMRLITYSCNEQVTKFAYSEIDNVMVGGKRKILAHLPKKEREDYWQQCMLTLQNKIGVIKISQEGVNIFEWEQERFLYDKSSRARLREKIRSGLGIGLEA